MTLSVDVSEGRGLKKPFTLFTRGGNFARDESLGFDGSLNKFFSRDTAGQAKKIHNPSSVFSAVLNPGESSTTRANQPPFVAPESTRGPLEAGFHRKYAVVDVSVSVSGQPPDWEACAESEVEAHDMASTEVRQESCADGRLKFWDGGQIRYVESSF